MKNPIVKSVLAFMIAFALSGGTSYALTTYLYTPESGGVVTPITTPGVGGGLNIDPSAPRTSECPINGQMYTSAEEKVWQSRRPLFVMIENSVDARPQSGLNSADILYEAVAEGGISRFGAVFYCGVAKADTLLAPVRSARTHFINLASEYNYPIYQHVGGANRDGCTTGVCATDKKVDALGQIESYGWKLRNDLDARAVGLPVFKRNYSRLGAAVTLATEHTMTTTTETVYKYMSEKRNLTNKSLDGKTEWKDKYIPFVFKDDAKDMGSVNKVSFGFWESNHDFDVTWTFDPTKNIYTRENGGVAHKDLNDDSTLTAKVVVVQLTKELGPLDEGKHMLYEVIGTGKGFVFQDGTAVEATWSKKDREAKTIWTDAKGKKISFNRGKIVFEIIPLDNTVTY